MSTADFNSPKIHDIFYPYLFSYRKDNSLWTSIKKPKNSRQIGYALRTGKLGENIPAHRILNASGILSGAASFETYDQQKLLLENEGITVIRTDKGWKTDLKKYQWKTTFDDALYFENLFKQANI